MVWQQPHFQAWNSWEGTLFQESLGCWSDADELSGINEGEGLQNQTFKMHIIKTK